MEKKEIDQNFAFQQLIEADKVYQCTFFGNFSYQLVYTTTFSTSFEDFIKKSLLSPFTVIHFITDETSQYFCYCCQNYCFLIEFHDINQIHRLLNAICCYSVIYLTPSDMEHLKKLGIRFKIIPEHQHREICIEYSNLDRGYFDKWNLNKNWNSNMTFSKFLAYSHSLISCFYIRRNFFPISEFNYSIPVDCPDHIFQLYYQNDFYLIRFIKENIFLCFNLKHGYFCVRKSFCDTEKFEKEKKRIISIKRHPNIINCFGWIEPNQQFGPSLLFEFASNFSLDYLLKNSQINDTTKTRIAFQILGGLDYLHMNGFIYQNLYPENVLIDSNFNVFLSNFSKSRIFNEEDPIEFDVDLGLYGIILYNLCHGRIEICDLNLVRENKMPYLSIEFGSIVSLYEKCVRSTIDCRISTFYYLKQFKDYYYYFTNAELNHLNMKKIYNSQIYPNNSLEKRKDLNLIIQNANKNNPVCSYYLGIFYRDGCIYQKNIDLANRKFIGAANLGLNEANYELIDLFFKGLNKFFNIKMVENYLKDYSTQPGNFPAKLYYVKHVLMNLGKYTPTEKSEALDILVKIADFYGEAQSYLGELILEGKEFQKNDSNAVSYLRFATNQASSSAVYKLAKLYETGIANVIDKDDQKSLNYMLIAVALRNENALNDLIGKYNDISDVAMKNRAFSLIKIIGKYQLVTSAQKFVGFELYHIAKDTKNRFSAQKKKELLLKSFKYLKVVADKGDNDSLIVMAREYLYQENIDQDIGHAMRYYERYKSQGGSEVIPEFTNLSKKTEIQLKSIKNEFDLTIDFYNGLSLDIDTETLTINNFFSNDDPDAIFMMSRILLRNKKASFENVVNLLKKSAESNPLAQNELGKIYFYGIREKRNLNEAHRLLLSSAQKGVLEAAFHLSLLLKEWKRLGEYFHWMLISSTNNYVNAMIEMAEIYEKNSPSLSLSYLRTAVLKKNCKGLLKMALLIDKFTNDTEVKNLLIKAAEINCIEAEEILKDRFGVKAKLSLDSCINEKNNISKGHYFECLTCGIINGLKICSFCARTKHANHNLLDLGEIENSQCCKDSPS